MCSHPSLSISSFGLFQPPASLRPKSANRSSPNRRQIGLVWRFLAFFLTLPLFPASFHILHFHSHQQQHDRRLPPAHPRPTCPRQGRDGLHRRAHPPRGARRRSRSSVVYPLTRSLAPDDILNAHRPSPTQRPSSRRSSRSLTLMRARVSLRPTASSVLPSLPPPTPLKNTLGPFLTSDMHLF